MAVSAQSLKEKFFTYLFGEREGYVCIATQTPKQKATFKQHFFQWPADANKLSSFLAGLKNKHVWFCVNLLSAKTRTKEYALPHNLVWADLDTCHPDNVEPAPQVVIESSPQRWQALWRLQEDVEAPTAEFFSKKIAYAHSENGADPSGWDLTQLLRVPFTRNLKYPDAPEVRLHRAIEVLLPPEVFWQLPDPPDPEVDAVATDVPDLSDFQAVDSIVFRYYGSIDQARFSELFFEEPPQGADWSRLLWRLIHVCFEAGMKPEEIFIVTNAAKCNKYARDKRPPKYLWRDVKKAELSHLKMNAIMRGHEHAQLPIPELVSPDETDESPFIHDYCEWAIEATDALPQYHEVSAFIVLSAVLAQRLTLETQYGETVPNLWAMILGDSTLTRKTTAMRLATGLIEEVDRSLIMATDGSAEGLLRSLSQRPHRSSIYYRDEITGLFESMLRKEYLAGMAETLTHLYDVPSIYSRVLSKDTIEIRRPIFIFYGGGIRDRVYALLNDTHVLSGFLPRFLVVSGEGNVENIRRTGPANAVGTAKRAALAETLHRLNTVYGQATQRTTEIGGQQIPFEDVPVEVQLSNDAWERYGDIEMLMAKTADESSMPQVAIPTYERLSRNVLKMSMLVAAARQEPEQGIVKADVSDVIVAAKYVQRWMPYTVDLLQKIGTGAGEQLLNRILRSIRGHPGVTRGQIMQWHHLNKRDMDQIQSTLQERFLIAVERQGRGWRYTAI